MNKRRLEILFEDKHLIIVNKSGNMPTIKSDIYKDNLYSEVYEYLHKKNQKIFVVHRLDKDTSGIVVFAKSETVKEKLQNNWDNVERNYIAVVHGITKEEGIIKSYLKETKTLYTYSTNDKTGKYAETIYHKIKSNKQYSLLKINIKTGRKNQIRVHMKDIHHPVVGDKIYSSNSNPLNRLALHSNQVSFIHPVTQKIIDVYANIPEVFNNIV